MAAVGCFQPGYLPPLSSFSIITDCLSEPTAASSEPDTIVVADAVVGGGDGPGSVAILCGAESPVFLENET
jgi:hypothetical protein